MAETAHREHFPGLLAWRRRPTRQVMVGTVGVGGSNPIRVQSMLTCPTHNVEAVLAEMALLQGAGCEIVRVTVPTQKDLDALPAIRQGMASRGIVMPLVADIHFNPRLAEECVPFVDKVRINPGNFADQKKFSQREYTQAQYEEELARVEETLVPLIRRLKHHGKALRVGVNHGSLSDRVINRHGDSPQGMVEAAMEYLRILSRHGYHDILLSMKSSNPLVMIQAYRRLALALAAEGMDYPLHLGVTEAGDGWEGILKSAAGIGALLADGLGDTIRVSLTGPAVEEIPAAQALLAGLEALKGAPAWPEHNLPVPLTYARRATRRVMAGDTPVGAGRPAALLALGGTTKDKTPPLGFDGRILPAPPDDLGNVSPVALHVAAGSLGGGKSFLKQRPVVMVQEDHIDHSSLVELLDMAQALAGGEGEGDPSLLAVKGANPLYALRRLAQHMAARGLEWPLAVAASEAVFAGDSALLNFAGQLGALTADGLLDALILPVEGLPADQDPARFGQILLQATRLRAYAAEFISCPSCGRTLFDLPTTTARVKARTRHLTGVRIAVMGCVVNGPGEMADADFGYVGGAPGKVNLYRGKECVERGVAEDQAVERLVALIKQDGRWTEPTP
ncbi:MAG: (E)-4-hydroxy-3-methylbut-2-enyl-diphosphate synthase [Deltaproteobacteria bacterium]|nr:(E)-4-hydroxy-3-methylbut-2-enyl-diphosphate synthase [Deltaproteobacteria bacterium]